MGKAFVNSMNEKMKPDPVAGGPDPRCGHDPSYAACMMDFATSLEQCTAVGIDCTCLGDTMSKMQGCLGAIDCYTDFEKHEFCQGLHDALAFACPGQLPDC